MTRSLSADSASRAAAGGAREGSDRSSETRWKVSVDALQLGMWVAELDRPWLETPFLLQGFLVSDDIELDALRRHCRSVWVGLDRSVPEVVEALRREAGRLTTALAARRASADAAAARAAGAPSAPGKDRRGSPARRALRERRPERIGPVVRWRFERMTARLDAPAPSALGGAGAGAGGVLGWVRALSGGATGRAPVSDDAAASLAPTVLADIDAAPVAWPVLVPLRTELPRAALAADTGLRAAMALHAAVESDRPPDLPQLIGGVGRIVDSMVSNPDALMWAARMRQLQRATYAHCVKAAACMVALGREVGLPRPLLVKAGLIGLLLDVGKTRVPKAVLDKPGALDDEEFALVKDHVRAGLQLLQRGGAQLPPEVLEGIAQHHERPDGQGYPRGLAGRQIGSWGRMAAIVDGFCALTRERAYAEPLPPQDALLLLYQAAGGRYDERLVERFVRAVGVFPVGSLVMLGSREVAVVTALRPEHRLEPEVLVLTDAAQRLLPVPRRRDLHGAARAGDRRGGRIARGLPPGAYGLDPSRMELLERDAEDAGAGA
jgi:HD-GYP domain-containing protein (c-di-GMP phosphodiesterase class II)